MSKSKNKSENSALLNVIKGVIKIIRGKKSTSKSVLTRDKQVDKDILLEIVNLNPNKTIEERNIAAKNLEERIVYCLARFIDPDNNIVKITADSRSTSEQDKYKKRCNNITNTKLDNYSLINQSNDIIEIASVSQANAKSSVTMTLSVDTKTLNLFITVQEKTIINGIATTSLTNYIFPPVDQVEYKNIYDSAFTSGDNISDFLDFVISTRFDPKPLHSNNSSHTNYFSTKRGEIFKDGIEASLYRKYYDASATLPHFHFYEQRVTMAYGNSYSLAITPKNISKYLTDLANPENKNLRKYDLGMPFLSMLSNNDKDFNIPELLSLVDSSMQHSINEKSKANIDKAITNFNQKVTQLDISNSLNFSQKALFLAAYFEFISDVAPYIDENYQCELANIILSSSILQQSPYTKFMASLTKEAIEEKYHNNNVTSSSIEYEEYINENKRRPREDNNIKPDNLNPNKNM